MSADINWTQFATDTTVSLISGVGGLLIGIWRWGRRSAEHDQRVRDDYDFKISDLREEMRLQMTSYEKAAAARQEILVDQFKESFEGMRRQMDKQRLETEQAFVRKDDFRGFREEYREDMRDLKKSIEKLNGGR